MTASAVADRSLVFISYAEEDRDLAERIGEALAAAGVLPWRYHTDIRPGDKYPKKVAEALARAETVLILVSESSLPSQQVENELVQAFERRKRIIPILIGLSHEEFQERAPGWRHCLGGTVSIAVSLETLDERLPVLVAAVRGTPQIAEPRRSKPRPPRRASPIVIGVVAFVGLGLLVSMELGSRWRRNGDTHSDVDSRVKPEPVSDPGSGERPGPAAPAHPLVGHPVPPARFLKPDGQWISTEGQDRASLYFFFLASCPDCRHALPTINHYAKEFGKSGVRFVAVLQDTLLEGADPNASTRELFNKQWEEFGYDFPMAFDPEKAGSTKFKELGHPRIFLVGAGGTVEGVYVGVGAVNDGSLKRELEVMVRLLEQPVGKASVLSHGPEGFMGSLQENIPLKQLHFEIPPGSDRIHLRGFVFSNEEKSSLEERYKNDSRVKVDVEVSFDAVKRLIEQSLSKEGIPGVNMRPTKRVLGRREYSMHITVEFNGDAAMKSSVREIVGRYVRAVDEYVTIVAVP